MEMGEAFKGEMEERGIKWYKCVKKIWNIRFNE